MKDHRRSFSFDPGWLFVLCGLALCGAGILLPAERDLSVQLRQLEQMRAEEAALCARQDAYHEFLGQLEAQDPALLRRLAASQLNLIPAGGEVLLVSARRDAGVADWIDAAVSAPAPPLPPPSETALGRLTTGPARLWVLGGAVLSVFVGLLLEVGCRRAA